jgi:uncharacterized membrane protein
MNLRLFEVGLFGFILLFVGCYSLLMPSLTRRDILFGVTVAPDARSSAAGRRIIAGYRLTVAIFTVALLGLFAAAYFAAPDGWFASPWLALSLIAVIAIVEIPYLAAYRASTRLRVLAGSSASPASAPAAELVPRHYSDYVPWIWEVLPVAIIAATAAYLATQYASAPAIIPIHFDAAGNPNGYATKSIASYFALVWAQLGMEVVITGLSLLVVGSKAVPGPADMRFRRAWLRALFGLKMLVMLLFAFLSVVIAEAAASGKGPKTLLIIVPIAFAAVVIIGVGALAVRTGQGGARLGSPAETATDRTDDRHWFLGAIYHNGSDPAIFVERRFGVGWTPNVGNPRAILVIVLILATPIAIVILSVVASTR